MRYHSEGNIDSGERGRLEESKAASSVRRGSPSIPRVSASIATPLTRRNPSGTLQYHSKTRSTLPTPQSTGRPDPDFIVSNLLELENNSSLEDGPLTERVNGCVTVLWLI
jgi:hypothetical protein